MTANISVRPAVGGNSFKKHRAESHTGAYSIRFQLSKGQGPFQEPGGTEGFCVEVDICRTPA